jgi:glycerate 2-kinase
MIPADHFWTRSIRADPHGESITRILAASLEAVEPGEAVKRSLELNGDVLTVGGRELDLSSFEHIHSLGLGKAAAAMSVALQELLGPRLTDGLVITKNLSGTSIASTRLIQGGHPVPDERSLTAGREAIKLVTSLHANDLLFCLISGGGSALLTAPAEGLALADLQILTGELLGCGASIDEINTLRRHMDTLKGGGMVKLANGAKVVSLIISDVINDTLETIASGPTAPDPTFLADARAVIQKYHLDGKIPAGISQALTGGNETLKPGDKRFDNVLNVIIANNLTAAQAALKQAQAESLNPYLLRTDLCGEARDAAFALTTYLRQTSRTGDPVARPACIIAGGETTVTLRGTGKGGRNSDLALAAVSELADFPDVMLVSLATDGEDGPTDAAGAVVTGETFRRAAENGLRAGDHLNRYDSYTYFAALGDLLKPGPTGTNVNDLVFLFAF